MSFKISKTKLALYVSILLIFLPVSDLFYGNPLIKLAVYLNYAYMLGFIAVRIATRRIYIFEKARILMLFFLVMGFSTVVNSGVDIDKFISLAKMIIIILFIAAQWERNSQELILTVENVLLLLIFANLISVLLYPDGVYEYFMPNQWGGGEVDRQWILEQKNSFSYYCIVLLAASSIRSSALEMKICDRKWLLEYLICIASVVISKSSTGTIVLVVELIYLALYRLIGRENRFNSKFMTLVISCVYIIFVTGNTALFGNVIYALTGKSSNLSTRLVIWKNSFDYIARHPIIGGGYTFGDEFQSMLGNLHFSSTHNMVVQIMFYGGIVLLAVFIYMVIHLVKNASIIREQKIAYVVFGVVLMILIEGLTESLVGSVKIYILLQILISFTESEILYEKEVENGGAE